LWRMSDDAIVSVTPEIALDEGYTYAGGLGVLEGDKFYAAARLGLNYHVLTLLYREGYVDYELGSDGTPLPKPQPQPADLLNRLRKCCELEVKLKGERVSVAAHVYTKGKASVVFFEPLSPEWAASLTSRLFIEGGVEEKFYKYVLLARASAEYIKSQIGVDSVRYIDLQEAYTALLPLVLRLPGRYRLIIHTPGPWGHPSFPKGLFEQEFGYKMIEDKIVLTTLGAIMSSELIMVSAKHFDVMKRVIPHLIEKARFVTNGIDLERWMHPGLRERFEKGELNPENFALAKSEARANLVRLINSRKPLAVSQEQMIVVWARRMTKYKRPYFVTRLVEEARDNVVFVLGGKAHPEDKEGLQFMREFKELERKYSNVVYFHDYDVQKAKTLIAGGDLLLFTPFSGWEASGTSFMKAAVNGTVPVASRDGAAVEMIVDGVNGWLFGQDIRDLVDFGRDPRVAEVDRVEYEELKTKFLKALELYSSDREGFQTIALNSLLTFAPVVDMKRVLREYYPDLVK